MLGSLLQLPGEPPINPPIELPFVGDPLLLVVGVILFVVAVIILLKLKDVIIKVIINSVLGIIVWAIVVFVFQIPLDFLISLIVSAIFGLAGIGVLLVLYFLGITV